MANLIDKTIEYFSPRAAFERGRYRKAVEIQRKYNAGELSKRTSKVDRQTRSPHFEVNGGSQKRLRGFSRELERNSKWVKKALKTIPNNIIGADGIRPSFDGNITELSKTRLKNIWKRWAETTECDYRGRNTIYGLQYMIDQAMHRDGEVLVIKRWMPAGRFETIPLKFQVLEADFLDDDYTQDLDNGHYVINGVEFDENDQRVAYWIFQQHPGGSIVWSLPERERVAASDVLHIFREERPGQVRGIPSGVQAFLNIEDWNEFQDAQLIGKKVQAAFAAFIKTAGDIPATVDEKNRASKIQPGIIEYMSPGDEVEFANPPKGDSDDGYNRWQALGIAAAYSLTYEALTGDLSNVNFSAGRMGHIEMGRGFAHEQHQVIIPLFCDPVIKAMVLAARLQGLLPESITVDLEVSWTPPRREMIDPTKEVPASIEAVRGGITSWQEEVRGRGWNPDDLIREIAAAQKLFDDNGLVIEADARVKKNGPQPTQEEAPDPPKKKGS